MAKATRGTLQENLDGVSAMLMTEVTVRAAADAVFGNINDASALSH